MHARKPLEPVRWKNRALEAIDCTVLPGRLSYVRMRSVAQVCNAIRSMKVRGAPLIGVVGAYGMVLAAEEVDSQNSENALEELRKSADTIIQTRPTGVNLRWAVERTFKAAKGAESVSKIRQLFLREAESILRDELDAAHNIGKHGAHLLEDDDTVLTHCNAGALATAGYGTALAVIRAAVEQGKRISVIATETRPLFQGSRLTAYELSRDGIPVKVACDDATAQLMARGMIDKVIVGADRILRTGHVTNKIGTLPIAISAKFYGVPFYTAAPVSTVDMDTDPSMVVIEERDMREVLFAGGKRVAPRNVEALNPAFDITPPELVTGIVTDKGVASQPLEENLRSLLD